MCVAIIGSGWGINVQIPALRQAGLKIVALVGRDSNRTAALASKHGIPFGTSSIDEMLAREDVQFVTIVTPPSTHAPYAKKILEAGKHLLAEKPFAMNVQEAKEIHAAHVAACAKYNKRIIGVVDHELRFHSSVQAAKAFIRSGSFGRIHTAVLNSYGAMGPAISAEWNWWSDKSAFGGVLGAVGSHFIDLMSYLTSTEITRVQCDLKTIIPEKIDPFDPSRMKPVTSDDSAFFRTQHRSNHQSTLPSFCGSIEAPQEFTATSTIVAASYGFKRSELVLLSPQGSITVDLSNMEITFLPATRAAPQGDVEKKIVWVSNAPKEIVGAALISPFTVRNTQQQTNNKNHTKERDLLDCPPRSPVAISVVLSVLFACLLSISPVPFLSVRV